MARKITRKQALQEFGVGPLYHPDKIESLTPNYLSDHLKKSILYEDDLFSSCCDFLEFFNNKNLDLLIIDGDVAGIPHRDDILNPDTEYAMCLLQTLDYIPITLQNSKQKYVIKESTRELSWEVINETNVESDIKVKLRYEIKSGIKSIIDFLFPSFPILETRREIGEPIFCAVKISNEKRLEIIGVFGVEGVRDKFGIAGPDRVVQFADKYSVSENISKSLFNRSQEVVCSSTAFFATAIHNASRASSKFKINIGASVMDRVMGYDPHLPSALISREYAMKEPITFEFSELSAASIGLSIPNGTNYTIFRDNESLFITEKIIGKWGKVLRIPIATITNQDERITSQKISVAVKQSLSLNRSGSEASIKRVFDEDCSKYEPFTSQVAESLWYWMKNVQITGLSKKLDWTQSINGNDWKYNIFQDEESTTRLAKMIPLILRLSLGLFDPFLSKVEKKSLISHQYHGNQARLGRNIPREKVRVLKWGNDKIRYLISTKGNISRKGSYWVRPHSHKYKISQIKTIEKYRQAEKNHTPGFALIKSGDEYFGIRTVGDYWCNSDGTPSDWDGTYNFGKIKGKGSYSKMAIDWIKSIEEKEGIRIQHAEQGGEFRLRLGYDKNIKKEKYIWLDGYCETNHTVYEFHGDVWHGNPHIFNDEDECHPHFSGVNGTAKYLYQKTIEREKSITDMGFNLVTIWESDWKN